ncbi:hypothetical protein RAM80_04345 [Pseudomonas sp. App30]|uniref:hypothetical protein n=1 Tax=Pseudomonas sp. App30 TaxID=3068990 RepID=UPI003A7F7CFC
MKFHSPSMVLAALLSLLTAGAACATQMPAPAIQAPAPAAAVQGAANPWPNLLGMASQQPGAVLAYDDRRRDGHWRSHREEVRRAQWRREQARREAERRREWERRHHYHRR